MSSGQSTQTLGTRDAEGHLINDPYPTDYETGGFDLDAVGVLNQTITNYAAWKATIQWGALNPSP